MPRRNRILMKLLLPLGLLAGAVLVLWRRVDEDWEWPKGHDEPLAEPSPAVPLSPRRRPAARYALTTAFTCLFFAGAAFTAGAGDQMARMLESDDAAALEEALTATPAIEEPAADEAAAAEPPVETTPAPRAEAAPIADAAQTSEPAPAEPAGAVATVEPAEMLTPPAVEAADSAPSNVVQAVKAGAAPAPSAPVAAPASARPPARGQVTKQWVVQRAALVPARTAEIEPGYGEPTVWLNRELPDPTPPSARLARSFARQLVAASKRHGADWASVLGVLRAQGERGAIPAGEAELDKLAARMAGENAWRGALALSGRTGFADRADALADLYRSVGIEALVTGYEAAKDRLAERLLGDDRLSIYGGGRDDIAAGRVEIRVLVLLGYLAERHGAVTVSSLFSGHRRFARPGVVSAHVYGHAVDIAAVGEVSIAGNQQPGGVTEAAVRSVLLLPSELQPQQVISLLGLGGPSFPLRDHGDHIHVGY